MAINKSKTPKIFLSVGEASGDLHASNLVKDLKQILPDAYFYGMGGVLMQNAGVNLIVNSSDLAIVGGIEIITHGNKILRAIRNVKKTLRENPPDLVILIDYPGFNLRLAKFAKQLNLKVLYYISPQIWAWHQSRVNIVKKYVDMMAVVFPFEVDFYSKAQVPVTFVGHPLLNTVKPTMELDAARDLFQLNPYKKTIGLFPGSRKGEIQRLLPTILQAAQLLKNKYGEEVQFVLPIASSLSESDLYPYLKQSHLHINLVRNNTYDLINTCDAIIAVSGTVTLEIALLAKPMVIIYKMAAFNFFFIKRLIKIPFIGLCNIVAQEKIIQELIQDQATPLNISNEISHILDDKIYRETMIEKLGKIRTQLNPDSQKKTIADVVLEQLHN